jgi:hypothetical protein
MAEAGSILAYAAPSVEPKPATAPCARAALPGDEAVRGAGLAHDRPPAAHRGGLSKQRRNCYMNGREANPRFLLYYFGAGWSSPVARQAHNLKVVGSNPTPATKQKARHVNALVGFCMCEIAQNHLKLVLPRNAKKINAFSSHIAPCWRVHVTWMAHEMRSSVHQSFGDLNRYVAR